MFISQWSCCWQLWTLTGKIIGLCFFTELDDITSLCKRDFIWRFLLLTSVEAADPSRHGLGEDHAVLLGGTSVVTVGVVIHTDLRKVHTMLMSKPTWGRRFLSIFVSDNPTCLCVNTRQSGYIYTSDNMQWSFGLTINSKMLQKPAVREELPCVLGGGGETSGSDLVFRALRMKSSWVVPRRVFDGGTGVAHVFRGLLTLLGRRTGAGQSRLEKQQWCRGNDSETGTRHTHTH